MNFPSGNPFLRNRSLRAQNAAGPSPGQLSRLKRQQASPRLREEEFISIGIDFGTTYSGVSWAFSFDPKTIHQVKGWPYAESRHQDQVQVPTQFDLETAKWGYLIPKNATPIRWFKLLLLKPEDLKEDIYGSDYLVHARKALQAHPNYNGDGIVDLIARFLRELWLHALKDIGLETKAMGKLPFRVAVTVPAIWPSYARERLKQAVGKAGIEEHRKAGRTRVILVEEPEAAALCTLFERKKYPEVQAGGTFVVCDCGGGTVDIITYEVISIEPFELREAVKGDGKLCGAFLVDSSFENWMMVKSGLKFDNIEDNEFRSFFNDEWEYTLKRFFTGTEDQETFDFRPPARVFSKLQRVRGSTDSFPVPKAAIKTFFQPTFNGIRALVSEQKKSLEREGKGPPQSILLVGGLGGSPYLHRMLQELFENVLQPRRAWSAVAKGAVIAMLKGYGGTDTLSSMPSVVSRVSRFSYGVELGEEILKVNPPYDPSRDRVHLDEAGVKRTYRMTWYLRTNEPVDNRDPVSYSLFQWVSSPEQRFNIPISILISDAAIPPMRRDESVKELCRLEYSIELPWEELEKCVNDAGGEFRKAECSLTMKFEGEPKFRLVYGNTTAEHQVNVIYKGVSD